MSATATPTKTSVPEQTGRLALPGETDADAGSDNAGAASSRSTLRYGIYGAVLILAGSLLSGPVGLALVTLVHPTGAWHGDRALADSYHPIQTQPYFFGLILVVGCDLLIAAAYGLAREKDKTRALLALICAAAFTGLITFNYICQTTFIPSLLTHDCWEYDAIDDPAGRRT